MTRCLLPSAYLAPVSYYGQMVRHDETLIEVCDHYAKQTCRNRCVILAANGPQTLSVPVVKPATPKAFVRDIRISDHGNWRHLHWTALQSAYMNSPFFEFYADFFAPFYERTWPFLADFNEDLRRLVCRLLDIEPAVALTTCYEAHPSDTDDLRSALLTRQPSTLPQRPYGQVFSQRLGFHPDLSIVDLLFNMGPESMLYL